MSDRKRTALVTGASSGIGEAFAEAFAARGFDLVITARREDRLRSVADRITQSHGSCVHVIPCDLANKDGPAVLCAEIARRGLNIDALVNSAGFGVSGVFSGSSWAVHEAMLQVMVVSVTELTYRLLPAMIERGYGRIINVASIAGLIQAPAGTTYGAAKAFVVRFSKSLAREVGKHGVLVTAICPGFTRSEFHDVTGTGNAVGRLPRWLWMDARTVARQGLDAVMAGRPVYVNGGVNRALVTLFKCVPLPMVIGVGRLFARAYQKA